MTEYQLVMNDTPMIKGTLQECWDSMVNLYGDRTVADLQKANIRIESFE